MTEAASAQFGIVIVARIPATVLAEIRRLVDTLLRQIRQGAWHAGLLSGIYLRHYIEEAQRRFPDAPRLTADQYAVMDLIDELVNDPSIHLQMAFLPGDMQFLHNHQILHSRNDFENWPEPERHRHLLRLWMAPPNARSLPAVFAPRYGSVTPGDRGGIVVPGTRMSVSLVA